MADPRATLERGVARLGLALDDRRLDRLYGFAELLARWNRVYNLTGTKDLDQIVVRHLLDSLAVLPYVDGDRLIDVGTGAGLPGLPLALARPELSVTLLDANAKRIRFVRQALIELAVGNACAVHSRVEQYTPEARFDRVIARAFAGLSDMLAACHHLVATDGMVLAMKGPRAPAETAALPAGFRLLDTRTLEVPGLDARRRLVRLVAVPVPG